MAVGASLARQWSTGSDDALITEPVAPVSIERRWRAALADRLGLERTSVQATVGTTDLGTGTNRTWRFFDSLATGDPVARVGAGGRTFTAAYAAVIHNLVPQADHGLRNLLGARCASWHAYRADVGHLPLRPPRLASGAVDVHGVLAEMFQTWAIGQLDGGEVRAAVAELRRADITQIAAIELDAAGDTHAWTTSDTGAPAEARPMTVRAAAGTLAVHAHFDSVWRIDGRPLSSAAACGSSEGAVPWFAAAALSLARGDDTSAVWRRRAPTWADTFGPQGSLGRIVTGLIVADGVDLTVARRATRLQSHHALLIDDGLIDNDVDRARRHWVTGRGAPQVIGLVTAPIGTIA